MKLYDKFRPNVDPCLIKLTNKDIRAISSGSMSQTLAAEREPPPARTAVCVEY